MDPGQHCFDFYRDIARQHVRGRLQLVAVAPQQNDIMEGANHDLSALDVWRTIHFVDVDCQDDAETTKCNENYKLQLTYPQNDSM